MRTFLAILLLLAAAGVHYAPQLPELLAQFTQRTAPADDSAAPLSPELERARLAAILDECGAVIVADGDAKIPTIYFSEQVLETLDAVVTVRFPAATRDADGWPAHLSATRAELVTAISAAIGKPLAGDDELQAADRPKVQAAMAATAAKLRGAQP
jgi:hypothetical protein